jgi:hypothetical protein
VRSESFAFGGGVETPSKQPGSLIIHANAGANVLEIEYELQSKSLMTDARDDTKRNARVSNLPPSFRTATAKLQVSWISYPISRTLTQRQASVYLCRHDLY